MSGKTPAVVSHFVQGHTVQQLEDGGYINATELCRQTRKNFYDYRRLAGTKSLLNQLLQKTGVPVSRLIQRVSVGFPAKTSTFFHLDIAIDLAIWLGPEYRKRVREIVQEWMNGLAQHRHLNTILRHNPAEWVKRFREELYIQMYRLKGWEWKGMSVNRHPECGNITVAFIYAPLAPGLVSELKNRNSKTSSGELLVRYHQYFEDEKGLFLLLLHMTRIITMMEMCRDWPEFVRRFWARFQESPGTRLREVRKRPKPPDQGELDV